MARIEAGYQDEQLGLQRPVFDSPRVSGESQATAFGRNRPVAGCHMSS